MEKRNTILLTVIAIATLLVAVVGATFAYFTASVTQNGTENGGNTVVAKTYALTQVTMNSGNKVSSEGIYPGAKLVKDFIIKTTCAADTCQPVKVNLNVKITSDSVSDSNFDFGAHIKYTLYQMKSATDTIECDNSSVNSENGQYSIASSCTVNSNTLDDNASSGNVSKITEFTTSNTSSAVTDTVELDIPYSSTDKRYYVVVEYINDEGEQNTEQGHSFTVELTVDATTED